MACAYRQQRDRARISFEDALVLSNMSEAFAVEMIAAALREAFTPTTAQSICAQVMEELT